MNPAASNTSIGSSLALEFMSPSRSTSSSATSVGSAATQSRSASAAAVRVALKHPCPSPSSMSPPVSPPQFFDLRWLTTTVTISPESVSTNDWASDGRLRAVLNLGSTLSSMIAQSPIGLTAPGL